MTTISKIKRPKTNTTISCPRHKDIAIVNTPEKGRGVIATAFIPAGSLIESAPVIRMKRQDTEAIADRILGTYVFEWIDEPKIRDDEDEDPGISVYDSAVVLGLTSLFNHSDSPNSDFDVDFTNQLINMKTIKDVHTGEELTYDYGCKLWFEVRE